MTRLVPVNYANDFKLIREIDNACGIEHKLRKPQPKDENANPTTQPTTGQAQ